MSTTPKKNVDLDVRVDEDFKKTLRLLAESERMEYPDYVRKVLGAEAEKAQRMYELLHEAFGK